MSNQGKKLSDDKEVVGRLWKRDYIQNGLKESSLRKFNESGAQVGYMYTGPQLPNSQWKKEAPERLKNLHSCSSTSIASHAAIRFYCRDRTHPRITRGSAALAPPRD
jgi:hypothetical protein